MKKYSGYLAGLFFVLFLFLLHGAITKAEADEQDRGLQVQVSLYTDTVPGSVVVHAPTGINDKLRDEIVLEGYIQGTVKLFELQKMDFNEKVADAVFAKCMAESGATGWQSV